MSMHTSTHNADVSVPQEFQRHLSNESYQYDILDNGKHTKRPSKKKCKNREYNVKNNGDVEHQYLEMYCATT